MKLQSIKAWSTAALLAGGLIALPAMADTESVYYGNLVGSATVATPLLTDDNLFIDTFTTERGALNQITTFTIGADVTSFTGLATWAITTAAGPGPRLIGVDINIFDSNNNLVSSDTFAGVLAGFAHSTIGGPLLPGTYTLVATGNAIRDASLDISISAIPEPGIYAMLLAGIGVLGLRRWREKNERFS